MSDPKQYEHFSSQNDASKNHYPLQQEGPYYRYQPETTVEAPIDTKRSKGLVIFALFLVFLFLFSVVGMFLVMKQNATRLNQQMERRRNVKEDAAWVLPDAKDEDPEPTKLNSKDEHPLRQKHFSLEEAAQKKRGSEQPLSIVDIAKIGREAVVAISTEVGVQDVFGGTRTLSFAGSGSIITEDGYVLTNNHVVQRAESIMVRLDSGETYPARLVGADQLTDLAVIKIEADDDRLFPTVTLGDSDELEVGELAVAIGNPTGQLPGTVTSGIISALSRDIHIQGLDFNMIQTSASVNSGNSGGALFNSFAEVVGVITAKISNESGVSFEGLGFAIPINQVKPVIEDLIRYGYLRGRVAIGIYPETFDKELSRYYQIADVAGVFIRKVAPDSAADRAGLKAGDLIVRFGEVEITSVEGLNEAKKAYSPGDKVEVVFYRDGEKKSVELELLEARPDA